MENQNQISQNFDNEITFKVVVVGNAGLFKLIIKEKRSWKVLSYLILYN